MRMHGLFCLIFALSWGTAALGQSDANYYELELLRPENNVSSQPFIEFRARRSQTGGHAFVLTGQQLDNGTLVYTSVGGFYPDPQEGDKLLKGVFDVEGTVKYKIPDMRDDAVFRAAITPNQQRKAEFIVKSWEDKKYDLASQNCTHLVRDVARSLGLTVNEKDVFPVTVIESIAEKNDENTAWVAGVKELNDEVAIRNAVLKDVAARERRAEKQRRKIEALNRMREQMQSRFSGLPNTPTVLRREVTPPPVTVNQPEGTSTSPPVVLPDKH